MDWSGWIPGLVVVGIGAALVLWLPAYERFLRWRRRRTKQPDGVDATWADTGAGIDLELDADHDDLGMDPVQRRLDINACEAILAAGREGSAR